MVRLDRNELPFRMPSWLRERVASAIARIDINRYPDPGYPELKEILASRFSLKPENIILGNGGDEILWLCFTAFTGKDRPVFFFDPSFSEYERLSHVFGVPVVSSRISVTHEASFDSSECSALLRKHVPSLVLMDSPNNPTGRAVPASILEDASSWTQTVDSVLVIDEAYGEFSSGRFSETLLQRGIPPHTVILKTLSKAWGFAGGRLGYALCSSEVASALEKIRSPFNVNVFSAAAASELLRCPEIMQQNVNEVLSIRDSFVRRMNALPGWVALQSDANFVLLGKQPVIPDLKGIASASGFSLKVVTPAQQDRTWVRISIGAREEMESLISFLVTL